MTNIYDHLKSLITDGVIAKAAAALGENKGQVAQTVRNLIPTLLGGYLNFGERKAVQDTIKEAHFRNVLSDIPGIFGASPEPGKTAIGERFVAELFGSKEAALHGLVAGDELMNNSNTRKLVAMIGTVVAGMLGKHDADHSVYNELLAQQPAILAAIPTEYKEKLGIKEIKNTAIAPQCCKRGKMCWLWWLLVIILVLLLLWWLLCWNKCCMGPCGKDKAPVEIERVVVPAQPLESNTYELSLDTGEKLTVTKGTMIDRMVTFLRSDTYKNATDADLQKNWFDFEGLDFVYNSGTEFVAGSDVCLSCLGFVLKYFPDAKIRIGGNADLKGREGVNLAISKQRAGTIKDRLVSAGIAANRVSTEGFGQEKAVIPATATDAERAPDRDIALRFVK